MRKKIEGANNNFTEGNRYEIALEDRIAPYEWLPDYLIEFRLSTYPLIKILIDFLPESNMTRNKALDIWYDGRSILPERDKDKALPSWKMIGDKSVQIDHKKKWWQLWK
jgi:hypothetical protein